MKEKVEKFLREEGVILPKNFVVEVYSQILKVAGPFAGLIRRGSVEAGLAELIGVFFNTAGLLKAHSDESKALSPLIGVLEGFVSECYGKPVKVEVRGREIKITSV